VDEKAIGYKSMKHERLSSKLFLTNANIVK